MDSMVVPAHPGVSARQGQSPLGGALVPSEGSSVSLPVGGSVDEVVLARLGLIASLAREVCADLVGVSSEGLARVAAAACVAVSAVEAARAGVVLEASGRGVVACSDHPRTDRWVEQACRDGGVPVVPGAARALHEVAVVCGAPEPASSGSSAVWSVLRDAVVGERLSVVGAARVAQVFRVLRGSIEYPDWDGLLEILIGWAADGARAGELAQLQEVLIGQYGRSGALDAEHEAARVRREFTGFRRDGAGMMRATLRLDPASEAVVTAALHALSAPRPDPEGSDGADGAGGPARAGGSGGVWDERSPGQRRADALVVLAQRAVTADPALPGSGSRARVVVTVSHDDLLSGLDAAGRGMAGPGAGASGATQRSPGQGGDLSGGAGGERGFGRTMFTQVLSPTEVRMLACDAHVIPAVLGSAGEVLDVGREVRLISPGQRMALTLRDGGCTYPGCTMPAAWCDGHHVVHWAQGGPTDLDNLALLCRHHHTEVHRKHHTATIADEAAGVSGRAGSGPVVRWTRWDGTPIGNHPYSPPPRVTDRRDLTVETTSDDTIRGPLSDCWASTEDIHDAHHIDDEPSGAAGAPAPKPQAGGAWSATRTEPADDSRATESHPVMPRAPSEWTTAS